MFLSSSTLSFCTLETSSSTFFEKRGRLNAELDVNCKLSFLAGDEAIETALGVLEFEMDEYLQYTLDETMRKLEIQ